MANRNDSILTEEFLAELYNGAISDDFLCSLIARYMDDSYLPDRDYQTLNDAIKKHFFKYNTAPRYGVISQMVSSSRAVSELLQEIKDLATGVNPETLREQFEQYLKLVKFKKAFRDIEKKFDSDGAASAIRLFEDEAKSLAQFSLAPEPFVDVAETFESRLASNKDKHDSDCKKRMVNRFYIDGLDAMNNGRNLRTQLTVALAMSGVGKSHLARWIGYNAAYIDGLDVLHFQVEGAASEVLDAYSALLVKTSTFNYETGRVSLHTVEQFKKQMEQYAGRLKVKAYSRFGKRVSTMEMRNTCDEFKKLYGKYPDVVIVDSVDLLDDASGQKWDTKALRLKRIAVVEDLKDLASDIDAWVFGTYQATIEAQEWVNDEKNVLNGYNSAEAKGIQRPCTHLVSLNQSIRESHEQIMRLHIAKARFFSRTTPTFKICTDYEHECFYDRERTLNLPQED